MYTAVSLAALLVLSFALVKFCRVPAGAAPVTALCGIMLWVSTLACFNAVRAAGWCVFAFSAVLAALCAWRFKKEDLTILKDPALIAFAVLSVLLLLLFAVRQPIYTTWDEYSFWGTATRIVKLNDLLYTVSEIGWAWPATQKPGLILLSYFFEFFGEYAEWRAIYAYDVLMLAAFCGIVSAAGVKKWHVMVPALALCVLIPYACTLYRSLDYPSFLYLSVLSDVPMGVLFAACVGVYYALSRRGAPLWPVTVLLAALTFVRDTALPLAMIAAVIVCADLLFCRGLTAKETRRPLWFDFGRCICFFAAPVVVFVGWVVYLQTALQVDPMGDLGGTETISTGTMLVQGVLQLLGIGTTEKYATIMTNMVRQYWTLNMTVLGSGVRVTVVALGIAGLAFLFSADKHHRRRCLWFAVLSVMGFVVFYLFNGFCYAFIFKDYVYETLVGYERYLYPYYIGWLLAGVGLLAVTAAEKQRLVPGTAGLALFALLALFGWRVSAYLTPGYGVLDYNRNIMQESYEVRETAEEVQEILDDPAERIFFISQGDNGSKWFEYSCMLLPLQLDYSYGGGTLCLPETKVKDTRYHIRLSQQELCDYIRQQACVYLFVETADDILRQDYGTLFSDGLALAQQGPAIYRVAEDGGEGLLCFEPVQAVGEATA